MREVRSTTAIIVLGVVTLGGCGSSRPGGGFAGTSAAPASARSGSTQASSGSPGTASPGSGSVGAPGSGSIGAPQPLPTPSGRAGGPRALGIDVAAYQHVIDWPTVKKLSGLSFCIARATRGVHPDGSFAHNWDGMKQEGMVRGAYHLFQPDQDPVQQADLYLSRIGGALGPGDLPPCLDVETEGGVPAADLPGLVQKWVDRVKSATGLGPIIYTFPSFWGRIGGPKDFSLNSLWISHTGVLAPRIPHAWEDYMFWQYGFPGQPKTVPGIPVRVVDHDMFHGTERDLRLYAGLPVTDDFVRGIAADPSSGGCWTVSQDGGVLSWGDAVFHGTAGGQAFSSPVLGVVRTPTGLGYWVFTGDGDVIAIGDAFDAGGVTGSASPIVAMAPTPSGKGYLLLGRDGSIHSKGDASPFAPLVLSSAAVGIAVTPSGKGCWVASADGAVAALGDATAYGDLLGLISKPVTGIAATPTGKGYWLVTSDGQVAGSGDATPLAYRGPRRTSAPVLGIAATPSGRGAFLVAGDGTVFNLGDAFDPGTRAR